LSAISEAVKESSPIHEIIFLGIGLEIALMTFWSERLDIKFSKLIIILLYFIFIIFYNIKINSL
jgi:hypothetical protein